MLGGKQARTIQGDVVYREEDSPRPAAVLVVVVELRHLEGREMANIYSIRFTLAAVYRDGTPIALVSVVDLMKACGAKLVQALRLLRKEIKKFAGVSDTLMWLLALERQKWLLLVVAELVALG